MSKQKTAQVSLRMSPRAKALLRVAADREHRSATNMVEHLLLSYCAQHGLDAQVDALLNQQKSAKGENQ